jgi:hypothetical protein
MSQISSAIELETAIAALESENAIRALHIKEEFELAVEKLSPFFAVTKTLNNVASSSNLLGTTLGTAFGIISGYLSRKLYVRGSDSLFRKVMGIAIQFGITNLAANNFEVIKSIAANLFQSPREGKNSKK